MVQQSPARCRVCGWTIRGGTECAACGAPVYTGPSVGAPRMEPAALLATHDEDYPELAEAFRAFRRQEWSRYVLACIEAAGTRAHVGKEGATERWILSQRSAVIVIDLEPDGTLTIDAPVVEVNPETEVALLRTALSGTHQMIAARPARRGTCLLLTMQHRIEALPPPRLVAAIRELAFAADALDNLYAFEFGGRLMGPQLRQTYSYDLAALPPPRKLAVLGAAARATPVRPKQAAPAAAGVVTVSALSRFLEVIREAQDLMTASTSFGTVEGAVHVALALRATLAGGVELDASRLLLHNAQRLRSGRGSPPESRILYRRLIAERGHCAGQWPLDWARLPGGAAKSVLAKAIATADQTRVVAHRRTILLGALAELILFCDLPPAMIERLRAVHDDSLATDDATVEALYGTLARASQ